MITTKTLWILQSRRNGYWITAQHHPYASATEDIFLAKAFDTKEKAEKFAGKKSSWSYAIDADPIEIKFTAEGNHALPRVNKIKPCPRCKSDKYKRERRLNGYTTCQNCNLKIPSKEWDKA